MTGFNHYPSCGCGWCLNNGRVGNVTWNGVQADALLTLRQYGAHRSRAACFIDHNARCPVCNARVFYYQNRHGSRVFFDDLAPLWTKHPCTDNRAPSGSSKLAFRSRGALAEIPAALGAAGVPTRDEWWFGIVEAIVPHAGHVDLFVRFTHEPNPRTLSFPGTSMPIRDGEVIGLRKGEVSFFDLEAMEPRTATVGAEIPALLPQPPGGLSLVPWEAALLRRGDWDSFCRCWQGLPYAAQMKAEEVCNFHTAEIDVAAFGKKLHPWVKAAWSAGRRSLPGMAEYLDASGVRTACGLRWNERRVYLLLKLIFSRASPSAGARPTDGADRSGHRATRPMAETRARFAGPARSQAGKRSSKDRIRNSDEHGAQPHGGASPAPPARPEGLDLSRLSALGRIRVRKSKE